MAHVIAIDGPAGAGKSTASRELARRLGWFLLDTGALYRTLALAAKREGIDWADEARLAERARALDVRFAEAPAGSSWAQLVFLDGQDVSEPIRTAVISDGASRVSSLPGVREALLDLQRELAKKGGCVVEGRDIGTVILPWAPMKFFVTASVTERATRRHRELIARGLPSDLAATEREIRERDERDETRASAPLKQAEDAVFVDTSDLSLQDVVDRLEALSRARLGLPSRR